MLTSASCRLCGQFSGQDQKFWQKKGLNKVEILCIKLNPLIDYVRSNLEKIPLRQLSDILYGIAFVH